MRRGKTWILASAARRFGRRGRGRTVGDESAFESYDRAALGLGGEDFGGDVDGEARQGGNSRVTPARGGGGGEGAR